MNIAHHPSPEMLLSYAAGATREASALLVATHLALCPECRKTVAAAESAGGAMLGAESAAMSDGAFDALLGRLDETQPETKKNVPGDIPEPLRSYVGANFCDLRWQMVAPGIWQIPFLKQGKTRARLLKVAPDTGVGHHSHHGEELTLVLAGGFSDETGSYGPGDVQTTTPDITHLPVSDSGEPCINLAVTDAPLRFLRKRDALIGWLFGF